MNDSENNSLESVSQPSGVPSPMGIPEAPPKKSKRVWIIITAAAVLFVLVGYIVYWDANLSPKAKMERETKQAIQEYQQSVTNFEAAMKNDTYGGATPQETLDMFIAALKQGDIDLASKYFMIETNERDSNYLTRKKWESYLADVKARNLTLQMAQDIERNAKPLTNITNAAADEFALGLFDKNGVVGIQIILKLNKYSKVWKIESM